MMDMNRSRERAFAEYAERERMVEIGNKLFGSHKHWDLTVDSVDKNGKIKERIIRDPLCTKQPDEYQVGDWGFIGVSLRAVSRVSNKEYLVVTKDKKEMVLLLRGFDMSKVTDNTEFILRQPVLIKTTYTYVAVIGSKNTVLVAESNEDNVEKLYSHFQEEEAKQKIAAESKRIEDEKKRLAELEQFRNHNTRKWTDSNGKELFIAQFLSRASDKVKVKRENGSVVTLSMEHLSEADQKWLRERIKGVKNSKLQTIEEPIINVENINSEVKSNKDQTAQESDTNTFKEKAATIEITSATFGSSKKTRVILNKQEVHPATGAIGRGLYVVALDKDKIVSNQVYDFLGIAAAANQFADVINKLPQGTIVILVVNDEATRNFNQNAQNAIESIGGKIGLLEKPFRSAYYCIGQKGLKEGTAIEAIGQKDIHYPTEK